MIAILIQSSIYHKVADGPNWSAVAQATQNCREGWWKTILHIHNFIGPLCIGHTWYLAIDMQLYFLSPLVLYWLASSKRIGWSALTVALVISLVGATIYNFINNFKAGAVQPNFAGEDNYFDDYYIHTLTRSSPFIVGMMFGYLLHVWKGKRLAISKTLSLILWIGTILLTTGALFATQPMKNLDYDNQLFDNFVNSFMRPVWALGLGWIIFACCKGYGGPVDWFLSHQIWKIPSRLTYAMYLFHYPILQIVNGVLIAPFYFSVIFGIYEFCAQIVLTLLVSLFLTLLVDSPVTVLTKKMLTRGQRPQRKEVNKVAETTIPVENVIIYKEKL